MSSEGGPVNDEIERLLEQGAVLLEPTGPMLPSEYGKRWMDDTWTAIERDRGVILDIAKLAEYEAEMWDEIDRILREEVHHRLGSLTGIANGLSQYVMHLLRRPRQRQDERSRCPSPSRWRSTPPTRRRRPPARRRPRPSTPATADAPDARGRRVRRRDDRDPVGVDEHQHDHVRQLHRHRLDAARLHAGRQRDHRLRERAVVRRLDSTTISTTQTPPTIAAGALSLSLATSP